MKTRLILIVIFFSSFDFFLKNFRFRLSTVYISGSPNFINYLMKTKSVKSNNPYKSVILTDIVKAHGGELTVESIRGEGAMFLITLPLS
jgi:light-regulated signal transduction histidine kinase (bacteriophytochrome)